MGDETYQKAVAPPWLKNPNGQALLGGLGAEKDALVDRLRQGIKARFPSYAPTDALPAIGSERQIDRGPSEGDVSYAARLRGAWDAWLFGGSAYGILRQLWATGMTTAQIVQMNGLVLSLAADGMTLVSSTLTTAPNVFGFDPPLTFWSKFAIVFPIGTALLTTAQASALSTLVKRWKRAAATYLGARVVQTGRLWGVPIAKWGPASTKWGATSTGYGP